jgi:hypothetical protein
VLRILLAPEMDKHALLENRLAWAIADDIERLAKAGS